MFVSTRPADKVKNEVSAVIGYTFKNNAAASIEIGSSIFTLYTEKETAWIKNLADAPRMLTAMLQAQDVVLKGVSNEGAQTSDTFSTMGLAPALNRVGQECN